MVIKFYDKEFSLEVGRGNDGVYFDISDNDNENSYTGGMVVVPINEIDNLITYLQTCIKKEDNGETN